MLYINYIFILYKIIYKHMYINIYKHTHTLPHGKLLYNLEYSAYLQFLLPLFLQTPLIF